MTIQTYALIDNLPPPPGPPGGVGHTASFTDAVTGEVWIANPGQAAKWYKARDWLHCYVYRAAALNMPTGSAIFQFDNAYLDYFYMTGPGGTGLGPNYGFVVPIPGWYRVYATLSVTVAVVGTYIQGNIMQNNTTNWSSDNWFSTRGSGGLFWRGEALMYLAANDIVNLHAYQPQGYPIGTTFNQARMELSYLGTG